MAVLCLVYLPIFDGQILFYRDPAHWNYPARWFVRESLARGDWPLWNPQQGLGFSVLANPLYGLFYPPNWLFLITPRALVASMLTWQSFAHVLWGSAGMVLLARRLRLGEMGATVAGLAWGLAGFTTAAWTTGLLLLSGAWLPWCGVGFVGLVRRVGERDGWIGGVLRAALPVAMAILLGEVFAALIGAAFGVAVAAVALTIDRHDRPELAPAWRRIGSALAAALVLAGAIGAVVVLPARAIAAGNLRGQPLDRVVAETCSLHPLRLLEFAAPGSMGYAYGEYPAAPWVGEKLLDGFPLMYSVYMGASVLALALLAFGRGRRPAAILGGLAGFTLLVSLGRFTPVHNVVRTVIRPLAYMRYPEKYLVVFVGFLALLAGLGARRVLEEPARAWRRTAIFVGLLVCLAAIAVAVFPEGWGPFMRWGAIKGAGAAALVLAVQLLVGRTSARATALILTAGVALDLAVAAFPHLGFGGRSVATVVPPAARAIVEEHRRSPDALAPARVYRAEKTEATIRRWVPAQSYAEGELRSVATLIPNAVTTFGVATLPGYDAAIPTLLPELWLRGQKVGQSVLRLLGIDYVMLPIEDPGDRVEHRTGIEPMLDPMPGARLYRVPHALPRVYLAARAEVATDPAALARLFDPEVVEGQLALLAPGAAPLVAPAARGGECRVTAFSNNRVEARCRADAPAIAVFLEQHDVGWTAAVDGMAVPLLRANLLMRAVAVAAGTHTITLSYAPPGLRAGALLSSLALLAFAVMSLTVVLRRARR
jgi:hypothetical protein